MNQALAKQTRRDIRRAFGQGAVDSISARDSSLTALQHVSSQLQEKVAGHAKWIEASSHACDDRWQSTTETQRRIFTQLEVLRRPFWGRLSWLVLGR